MSVQGPCANHPDRPAAWFHADGLLLCDPCEYRKEPRMSDDDSKVDGINLPLTGEQVEALAAGRTVRIDIPPEPELGTTRTTVVILRRMRNAGALPLAVHDVHEPEGGWTT